MDTHFWLRIFFYIIFYSFLGWILESVYKSIIEKRFINSGFLKGPICPIYGIAAVIMIFTLNSLKGKPLLLFVISFVVLSAWEYLAGLILEKLFKTKYWDYSKNKFNLHGRICLKNSIYWGILGVLFIEIIHPFIENGIVNFPYNILLSITIISYILLAIDAVHSIITTIKFESTMKKISELGETIKFKIEELKTNASNATTKIKNEQLIRKLKIKETKLKLRLYRNAKRLKLAFPTMKSENITSFLNQKIDIKKLKKLIKKGKE